MPMVILKYQFKNDAANGNFYLYDFLNCTLVLCVLCLSFDKVQKVIVSFSPCVYMCVTVHRNITCFCLLFNYFMSFYLKILKAQEFNSVLVSVTTNYKDLREINSVLLVD